MGRFRESAWLRTIVATLYIVVAATLGFAHKFVAPIQAPDPELAFLQLPDGSLPILCLSTEEGKGDEQKHANRFAGCDACRLTELPGLGAVDPPQLAPLTSKVVGLLPPRDEAVAAARPISPSARGPPSDHYPTA